MPARCAFDPLNSNDIMQITTYHNSIANPQSDRYRALERWENVGCAIYCPEEWQDSSNTSFQSTTSVSPLHDD
jgi:hypothetical protein